MFAIILAASAYWSAAQGGTITGRRETQAGEGPHAIFLWLTGAGANLPSQYAIGQTGGGNFTINSVPGGTYWLVGDEHSWYRHYFHPEAVLVPTSGTVNLQIRDRSTYDTPGMTDLGTVLWAAQTFAATGRDVAVVMALSASGGANVSVTIREGGPGGPQIGPARVITHGPLSPPIIRYQAGEVPLIPGRVYAVRQESTTATRWTPVVSYVPDPYPNGMAYFDGVARPEADLRVGIACRDDGLIDEFRVNNGFRTTANQEVVQTFVPVGRELRLAEGILAGSGNFFNMRASVHRWNGAFPLGEQIGPAKHTQWIADTPQAFVWAPGEVPLTPGQPYTIRYTRVDGGPFTVYGNDNGYAAGQAYFDRVPDNGADMNGRLVIVEPDRGDIQVSNVAFTPISATQVLASFNTDVAVIATVAYRVGTPTFETIAPADSTAKTAHQITLHHLAPGISYEMSILAHHAARNALRTAPVTVTTLNQTASLSGSVRNTAGVIPGAKVILDELGTFTFTDAQGHFVLPGAATGRHTLRVEMVAHQTRTQEIDLTDAGLALPPIVLSAYTNLLSGTDDNPVAGWIEYGQFDGQWNSGDWNVPARTGPKWVGSVGNQIPKTGGIRRGVSVEPGKTYVFSGYVLTDAYPDPPSTQRYNGLAVARLGVDPTGGTSPSGPTVIWGRWRFTSRLWKELSIDFTAQGPQATLFAAHKHENYYPNPAWFIAGFDDLWVGSPLASAYPDVNGDGDVDQEDFGNFQTCLTGPAIPQESPACAGFRFDADQDVDADDFLVFLGCMAGPNVPFDPGCLP